MSRLVAASTFGLLLIASAAAAAQDAPLFCTSYTTGADTHTTCAPPASAPVGAAFTCYDYLVGSDTHAACAPVAAPRLAAPRGLKALPVAPPAFAVRCSTYQIGASVYTDCR